MWGAVVVGFGARLYTVYPMHRSSGKKINLGPYPPTVTPSSTFTYRNTRLESQIYDTSLKTPFKEQSDYKGKPRREGR